MKQKRPSTSARLLLALYLLAPFVFGWAANHGGWALGIMGAWFVAILILWAIWLERLPW